MYVHLLVCYLNKLQNARCNDKDLRVLPATHHTHIQVAAYDLGNLTVMCDVKS